MEFLSGFFEQHWPLSGVVIGETLKDTKGGRTVAVVNADEGKFVFKRTDEWKTREALDRDLFVFELLPEKGFTHIPKLLKTKKGGLFVETNGRFIYLLEYVGSKNPKPTVATYKTLGEITAELNLIQNYPHKTAFYPAPIIGKDLVTIAEKLPFRDEYLKLVKSLPSFDALPEALIHTDIAPSNTVERDNGNLVLIDWDDAGVGIRILDVAFPLIQQFISEDIEVQADEARAFYSEYRSKVELTPEELSSLFPAALFIALMYIVYGDTQKRWGRIRWAIAHRTELESLVLG